MANRFLGLEGCVSVVEGTHDSMMDRGGLDAEMFRMQAEAGLAAGPEPVTRVLSAGTPGPLDKVAVPRGVEWPAGFIRFLKGDRPGLLEAIDKQQALDDTLFARLNAAIPTFNHQFGVEGYTDQPDPSGAQPKPAAKEPAAKEPAAKEPAAKEPAAKEPAAKEPAAKEPAPKEKK